MDWKILALEYHELSEAILDGRKLEVDGNEGTRDVAVAHALCESAVAGRAVTLEEMMGMEVYEYQRDIDQALNIEH